ncbi:hypothetical protein M1432_00610 [Patescibacteria group bacterium]|nr:hypothetical protein [Patescibacteria group bacterium]
MFIDNIFAELFPGENANASTNQKARAVLPHIGKLNEKDARWALCEMAAVSGIDPDIAAEAARLLPDVVGGNVGREPSAGEMEPQYLQKGTPP